MNALCKQFSCYYYINLFYKDIELISDISQPFYLYWSFHGAY